ncbi:MAG: hypothetical protein KDG52_16025, partial [Rhodocyclaceae bacterium]|nr:hypothetical protein [Rhodocyclaceae bacterium]
MSSADLGSQRIGIIEAVQGPVVDIVCDHTPPLHRALWVRADGERCRLEVFRELGERHVRAIALHRTTGLARGLPVMDGGGPIDVPVGPGCLGRMLDVFGAPLDGDAPFAADERRPLVAAPGPLAEARGAESVL